MLLYNYVKLEYNNSLNPIYIYIYTHKHIIIITIIGIYIALYHALLKALLHKTNAILYKKKNDRKKKKKNKTTIHCDRMTIQRKRDTQHYTMLKT